MPHAFSRYLNYLRCLKLFLRLSQGDAVEVYGGTSIYHGSFTPILDGKSLGAYQPFRTESRALNVLFFADNLGPGVHNLTLISTPSAWVDGGSGTLQLAYANVYTAVS